MKTRFMHLLIGLTILGIVLAACGPAPTPEVATEEPTEVIEMATSETAATEEMVAEAVSRINGAGDLRVALNAMLGEHALLALSATEAALRGSDAEFQAAAAALDENSVALSGAIGSVYGEDAGNAFLELWRTHIGFFVDYTTGVATNDQAMKDQAVADLTGYIGDFSASWLVPIPT